MRKLNTVVSAVNEYSQSLGTNYVDIAYETDNVHKEVCEMQLRVQQAQEDVTGQLAQASALRAEAAAKAREYAARLSDAQAEANAAQSEIDYVLSHPIPVTYEDADGNLYTEYVIDEAALAAAQSRYSQAMAEVYFYEGKCRQAESVEAQADGVCARFENLQRAISAMNNMIQEQLYQIKQRSQEIRDEAGYNLQCMRGVLDRLNEYLACKQIYFPSRPV